jgi:hypothetical protein
MAENNKINLTVIDDPRQVKEAQVVGTPKPGMLVERTSAGKIQAHSTASGVTAGLFLLENTANAGTIDTAYTADETGRYMTAWPGDKIYAWLVDEGNVAAGALLVSDGAGALKAATTETGREVVAEAAEAVDNTGGTGIVRIAVYAL